MTKRRRVRRLGVHPVFALGVTGVLLFCSLMHVIGSNAASGPELWRIRSSEKIDEARRVEELSQIAEGLRTAVLRKDSEALLKYYWRNAEVADPWSGAWAVANSDGADTYESEREILADPASPPYCALYDTVCRRAMAKPEHRDDPSYRLSVLDFFLAGPVNIEIFFRTSPDGARVDLDRAILVFVRTGSPSSKFSRLRDFESALNKWAAEFVWVELTLTRFGWRYERVLFGLPYDSD